MPASSSPFRAIGRIDALCPYCLVAFAKRPQRKAKCPACGGYVYVRTRPLDEARVLLTEKDAVALEEDWKRHYEIVSKQPRAVSPEWQARIDEAQAAVVHPNPEVEAMSQRVMTQILDSCAGGMSPRDAKENALLSIPDPAIREAVDRRVWQLQVQFISGAR
jgi:hypothetical protein